MKVMALLAVLVLWLDAACQSGYVQEPGARVPSSYWTDEWELWSGSTQLRGANTWQRRPSVAGAGVFPTYNPRDLDSLAAWGANLVNLSVPGIFAESPTGSQPDYRLDPAAWTNLDSMVAWAERAGLFVVVSFRTGPGRSEFVFDTSETPAIVNLWSTPAAQDAWVAMWREAARRLKDRRVVVGYDLMVEPLLEPERDSVPAATPEDWYLLAERIIEGIRDIDPTTPILLSVAPGGDPEALGNLDPKRFNPQVNRVVFTFHQYEPFNYTHQRTIHSAFDCASGRPLGQEVDPVVTYEPWVRERVEQIYAQARRWKEQQGVALAVNELGVMRWVPGADAFMREQLEQVEEDLGANHALWVWDPERCLGWDEMNFRNGPDPARHRESPRSPLPRMIRSWWRTRNSVRP